MEKKREDQDPGKNVKREKGKRKKLYNVLQLDDCTVQH